MPWLPQDVRTFLELVPTLNEAETRAAMREAMRGNLWLLLVIGLQRQDLIHPWLLARCQEVQASPDGHLDLWFRGGYKSSIITFAKTIQDILASHGDDPLPSWKGHEPTFGFFSHTRPIAKGFLRQIKLELERNEFLQELFPDVLYARPQRDSPRWSEDSGLVVKRKTNPKESTVEAWGLVDGQPTSKHFSVLIWDDVVVLGSVSTPDMIKKTTDAWELSLNLGTETPRLRMIGTRYHFGDTYKAVMDRGSLKPRLHPVTVDGSLTGEPVLFSPEALRTKMRDMGPYTSSAQLFLNPLADSAYRFERKWLDHRFDRHTVVWEPMQRALICDPSSGKKGSDYTAMGVIGKGPDRNVYVLDYLRDRLSLKERAEEYIKMHKKWRPQHCGYEEYGMQADIEYVKSRQNELTYRFEITPLAGKLSKFDRVNRLVPVAADGHLWLPEDIHRTNHEGQLQELIGILVEQEFLAWPVPAHDDGVDMISRYFDLEFFNFPVADTQPKEDRYGRRRISGSFMSA